MTATQNPAQDVSDSFPESFPATYPYVNRILSIMQNRPHDDGIALVLIDYAREAARELQQAQVMGKGDPGFDLEIDLNGKETGYFLFRDKRTTPQSSAPAVGDAIRKSLEEMVAMMDSGDEHGKGSPWYEGAVAALTGRGS